MILIYCYRMNLHFYSSKKWMTKVRMNQTTIKLALKL